MTVGLTTWMPKFRRLIPSGTRGSTNLVSPVSRSMQSSSRGLNVEVSVTRSGASFFLSGTCCEALAWSCMTWSWSACCRAWGFSSGVGRDEDGVGGVSGEDSRCGDERVDEGGVSDEAVEVVEVVEVVDAFESRCACVWCGTCSVSKEGRSVRERKAKSAANHGKAKTNKGRMRGPRALSRRREHRTMTEKLAKSTSYVPGPLEEGRQSSGLPRVRLFRQVPASIHRPPSNRFPAIPSAAIPGTTDPIAAPRPR